MGFAFNPFTGNFDAKGSGGGGSSYIDGEVQNFSALPETAGTPPVDSAYLVREAEGAWLLNRKPAGIYIRTANTGIRASDWTYAGEFPDVFSDDKFVLYDETDSSKNLVFQLSGLTTGTTRTLTAPNASGRIQVEGQPIGNTTPNSGAFTTLSANNGTLTASAPVLDLAQTWNNSGVTFTGLRFNVTNTQSDSNSLFLDLQIGGLTQVAFRSTGELRIRGTTRIANLVGATWATWITGSYSNLLEVHAPQFRLGADGSGSTRLFVDATHTFAQRDGLNPQTFRLYNTFTDANNHERGFMRWSSNVLQIGTEKGSGGGSARALQLQTDGTTRVTIDTTGQVGIGVAPDRPFHIQGSAAFIRVDRQGSFGPALLLTRMATGTTVTSSWLFGPTDQVAGVSNDDFAIIDFGTAVGGTSGTQRLTISKSTGQLTVNGNLNLSTKDLVTDTTTGTKIGTGTTQKIGFFNATPVVQQAAIADATDAATTQARLNDLLAAMRSLGLIAT